MSSGGEGAGGIMKIVGGIAVFIACWIVQATMGDSSMFSMSYVNRGTLQGLLVNVTFWPGWILTGALIVAGIQELREADDSGYANPQPWEAE